MSDRQDTADKPYDATPKRLEEARRKGEVARSVDVATAAGYAGWLTCGLTLGGASLAAIGNGLMVFLDQPHSLAALLFQGAPSAPIGGLLAEIVPHLVPWFLLPMAAALLAIIAQRAFVVTPSKLLPKLNRISPIQNAKNKYGRSGLFEFFKSFVKLTVFALLLAAFLRARMSDILGTIATSPNIAITEMLRLMVEMMSLVLVIAAAIAVIDYSWQRHEFLRKNRMSHKELQDETKESEGDPHMKQERRSRAQTIASRQMLSDAAEADVVVVNPTHFAVALKWSRQPGDAPECVAKGQDELARRIREIAMENGVPIRSDPPTARALYASVEIGQQIGFEHYRAVAAAIRFADDMRRRASAWR